ncbi:MAG: protein kinase, partial [Planctomycetota bacterium]|nr:protein kinase [Planctomycetota bacterium]
MSTDEPHPGDLQPDDFQRVAALFESARELHADERAAWLDAQAVAQPELRAQVERLLAHHDGGAEAVDRFGDVLRDGLADVTALGPYRVVRELGAGGMGVVYLAEQTEPLQRLVALKVIRAGLRGPEVVTRFERERQTLARLVHPGIAQVHDAGSTEDGRPYVALEYVDGQPIHTYACQQALDLEARLALFVSVCRAVEFAHQKGVIHRDLKPGNILVTEVDGRPVPKVIDFGIAKVIDDDETNRAELTELTAAGSVIGTPAYMSPEQALLGSGDLDTRSDIYSLGVILYELLAGALPFDAKALREAGPVELRRMFAEDDPTPPSTRVREAGTVETRRFASRLEGDLDWITMKALAMERQRRYSSAGAFADDIGRYLTDEPIEARPPSRRYRLGKFAKRHRVGLAAAALLLVTLLAGLVTSTALFFDAEEAREDADEARGLAEERLADVERTADLQKLATLTAEAEALWPATPSREPDLVAWLARAEAVRARLPAYQTRLAALRRRGTETARTADDATVRALDLLRREELAKMRDAASYLPGSEMSPPGDDVDPKPLAFYARHTFELASIPARPLTYRLHAFDGAILYLNGKELARQNLPEGAVTPDTAALGPPVPGNLRGRVNPALLVRGRNVLAVRIHVRERDRPRMQLTFDMDGPRGEHLVPIDARWRVQPPGAPMLEAWADAATRVDWPEYRGPVGFTPLRLYPPHVRAAADRLQQDIEGVRARKRPLEAELARRVDWT